MVDTEYTSGYVVEGAVSPRRPRRTTGSPIRPSPGMVHPSPGMVHPSPGMVHAPPAPTLRSASQEFARPGSGSTRVRQITGSGPLVGSHASHHSPSAPSISQLGARPRGNSSNDLIGQVIASYRLIDMLGSGGMGEVFRAEHMMLGREDALKLLRPEYAVRPESVARFFQEARAVNRIRHRNIVDVTHLDTLADGTPFIVMELLDGVSLREWMIENYHDTGRVLQVFMQICDALSAVHEVGIVHRDLKPDNVMVVPDHDGSDLVKLLDFGISKLLNADDESAGWKTTEGFVMGTPAYMSPEQAGGMDIDGRTDIYSLGAIMYEMFTGEPVFTGKNAGEYVRKHLNENPVPPRRTEGGQYLDASIEEVILRCLAKEPSDRYASALALRRDLQRITAGEELQEAASTTPMRRSDSPTPALSGAYPAAPGSRRRAIVVHTPSKNQTAMAVGDLPSSRTRTQPTGRKVLWSIIPLAMAASAAVVWFYMRPPDDADSAAATGSEAALVAEGPAPVAEGPAPAPVAPVDDAPPAVNPPTPERATPQPTVAPIEAPELGSVIIRFISKPAAEVYVDSSPTAQCTTPCDVTLSRGPQKTRRIFIQKEGYHPVIKEVSVDKPPRRVRVSLKRMSRKERARERARRRRDNAGRRAAGGGDDDTVIVEDDGARGDPSPADSPDDGSGESPGPGDDPPSGGAGPDRETSGSDTPRAGSDESTDRDPGESKKVSPSDTLDPFRE